MSVDAVEKALGEFELIGGVGSAAKKKACAMTLLAWLDGAKWNPDAPVLNEDGSDSGELGVWEGGEWTDHPPCTHSVIANNVIRANDASDATPPMRQELVRAGRTGALDTWWVPGEVIAMSLALKDGEGRDVYERTMRMLARIAEWKEGKERPDLRNANLRNAYLRNADLRDANLEGANLRNADLRNAYLGGADLRNANLEGANLRNAYLGGANLGGANLRDANGTPWNGMPASWKLDANGLWVRNVGAA